MWLMMVIGSLDFCCVVDDGDWIFGFLNGYVNFIDGSLVEWDGG